MSLGESSTPLGRVRGTGSAKHGGEHWLRERLTSAALLLLGLWLIASLLLLPDLRRGTLVEWLASPSGAVPMFLFVIITFVHAVDGMKVVIDDYVHDEANRFLTTGLVYFAGIAAGALALFSLARIAFGAD
ncbi:succinate dehydrogenase, hydrophobic membrane anchor protein [Sphingomonas mesophila]|uniref:succinate dehydrogenase, hydrophobic membrane anchor protein n=1 Tax=Sphingomonas mesophila TaxID=2303576 RepID=UPI000E578294|nr:succinate dehydrogenase, hydrophobic membrane anchor protein [Sphingomonas mesophila]